MSRIGIFDSGLGGLFVARAIRKALPEYNYVYLGDSKRVPYGNRSGKVVKEFTHQAVKYLIEKEKCSLIILACNTASAQALKEMQKTFKTSKILGVLIPAAEDAAAFRRVGVLATLGTVNSGTFPKEISKINKNTRVFQEAAPLLVPFAEAGETREAKVFIKKYLNPLLRNNIEALVLGCTHYPIFKKEIRKLLPVGVKIISQDEIIPKKLKSYLQTHSAIEKKISKERKIKILVTDKTKTTEKLTREWFGKVKPQLVEI